MWFQNSFRFLTSTASRRRPSRPPASRPCLEPLEDRCLLSFSPAVDYPVSTTSQLRDLVVGDFNGDAAADIVTVYDGMLLGNGDGTFQPAFSSGLWGHDPVAGDFDNDGRLDLVSSSGTQLGNGDGTFRVPISFNLPAQFPPGYTGTDPLSQAPTTIAVGNLNGDGTLDLAVIGVTSYRVIVDYDEDGNPIFGDAQHPYFNVLLGQGDGTFTTRSTELAALWPLSLAIGDLNNDGLLDVVTSNTSTSAAVSVLLGNGNGTFQARQDFGFPGGGGGRTIALGDFSGDGAVDVATTDYFYSDTQVFLGNGDGTLQNYRHYTWGYDMAVADVNGDGMLDLCVTSYSYDGDEPIEPVLRVQLGRGDGSFADALIYPIGPVSDGFATVAVEDFNGDGFPDLALAVPCFSTEPPGNLVKVMINDGIWTPPSPPPPPSITMSDVTVTEGNSGRREARFTVTLSAAYGQPITVAYATGTGTATAGGDYQPVSGTLTILAGQTVGTITVLVNGDRLGEPNETFVVNLSSPTNATIADGQAVGTIMDDEPRISISDVTNYEGKKGKTTLFTFTVTLSATYDEAVTMSFQTVNGTATTGDGDYIAKTGTITFYPGETTKTITIEVKGDSKKEANETFYLDLFGNSSNSLFTKNRGLGTILNDD